MILSAGIILLAYRPRGNSGESPAVFRGPRNDIR